MRGPPVSETKQREDGADSWLLGRPKAGTRGKGNRPRGGKVGREGEVGRSGQKPRKGEEEK